MISQQFVVTVHKDITKETKRKLPAFHAYQVSLVMKQVEANAINAIKIRLPIQPNKLRALQSQTNMWLVQAGVSKFKYQMDQNFVMEHPPAPTRCLWHVQQEQKVKKIETGARLANPVKLATKVQCLANHVAKENSV